MITIPLLFSLLSLAYGYLIEEATDNGNIRALATYWGPDGSFAIGGASYTVDQDGDITSGSAELDVAAFKWDVQGACLGFFALQATGSYDLTPAYNTDGTSTIWSIKASFAELILGLGTIFLWEDKDGEDGFKYTLGDDAWSCTADGVDCVRPGSAISCKDDLVWTYLSVSSAQSCPSAPEYKNCSIWTLTSSGYYLGAKVITVTMTVSNQNVLIKPTVAETGQSIGPDNSKIDIEIWYPWTLKLQSKTGANVALVAYGGGKCGSAGIIGGYYQGKEALVFAADGADKYALIAFDGTATLDSVSGKTYVNGISGSSILNFDCSKEGCDIATAIIIGAWQLFIGLASAGGWTSQLVILSWVSEGCDYVKYDPTTGMASPSEIQSASAAFAAPTLILSFFLVALQYFIHRR